MEPTKKSKSGISFLSRKALIIFSIILLTALLVTAMTVFKPTPQKRDIPETIVKVDVVPATRGGYPILVNANGTVEADTRGNLVAQVRGEIIQVSNQFKTGGTFKKGDVLVQIDDRDYRAAMSQALASLSQVQAAYQQEQATARQAETDWKRLGNTTPAPELVLRKPQLAAAKAQWDSAKASYQTAKLNLERTKITAPYAGRVIRREAALGQYVGVGSVLAEIFSTDGVEVRLPLSQDEYNQLGLDDLAMQGKFDVQIMSQSGANKHTWQGKIIRTDSTFDLNTRQIDVLASVQNPFSISVNKPPLKIGQFVDAQIHGRTLDNIIVIPNKSVREGSYVYLAKEGRLYKSPVQILWQDAENALIAKGIEEGDLVVTTSLNSTLTGAKVKLPKEYATPDAESDIKPSIKPSIKPFNHCN